LCVFTGSFEQAAGLSSSPPGSVSGVYGIFPDGTILMEFSGFYPWKLTLVPGWFNSVVYLSFRTDRKKVTRPKVEEKRS
jgi:hypothetical protein